MILRLVLSVLLVVGAIPRAGAAPASASSAPSAPSGRGAAVPTAAPFPHALLTEVLARHVDAAGLVDYAAVRDDPGPLRAYLDEVARSSPHADPGRFPTEADRLAYWLNAYNALAIGAVAGSPGLHAVNDELVRFFYGTKYPVGGRRLSLYTIENRVVRREFADPRIHFALNCQSAGCPRLLQEAYVPERLDAQLEAGAREFVADPANVWVDADGTWHLSQIFEWYAEDFVAAGGAVGFVNRHGGAIPVGAAVVTIPYDWTLSAQPGRGP